MESAELVGFVGLRHLFEVIGLALNESEMSPRELAVRFTDSKGYFVSEASVYTRDILGLHGRAELPGDDIAREIVQNGREIEPAPADDLQISEIGLPELVRPGCLLLELICRFDHREGWADDQVMGYEQAIATKLKMAFSEVLSFGTICRKI